MRFGAIPGFARRGFACIIALVAIDEYPESVQQALRALTRELEPAAPEPRALVVYGSLVRGGFRPGESDVNLAVVVDDARPAVLEKLSGPLRAAWRAARVEPFLIAGRDVARMTDCFPIKLLDISRHHDVLHGADPFANLRVEPAQLRLRLEQQLRNHLAKLQRRFLATNDHRAELARGLFASVSSLVVELETLAELKGVALDGLDAESVFAGAARAFDLDAALLARLAAFKAGGDEADVPELYAGLLAAVARAVEIVDGMELA